MSVNKTDPAAAASGTAKPAKPSKPAGAVMISDLNGSMHDWNGGMASYSSGIWTFSANSSKDPGFHIDNPGKNGPVILEGKKALKFSLKGKLVRERSFVVLTVQVFGEPVKRSIWQVASNSINVELRIPQANENAYADYSLDLSSLKNVTKVLVMLATDQGSCSLQLKDLRIE